MYRVCAGIMHKLSACEYLHFDVSFQVRFSFSFEEEIQRQGCREQE